MKQLYESINNVIEFHDRQEICILQGNKEELLDLIRLYTRTTFELVIFLERRFRKVIWVTESPDRISQELQKEFKQRESPKVNFSEILRHLNKIIVENAPEQLGLSKKAVWQLRKDIQEFRERGIGFRNWYAHGGWNDEQKQKIFGSESVGLSKCQDLYRDLTTICRSFEKYLFN